MALCLAAAPTRRVPWFAQGDDPLDLLLHVDFHCRLALSSTSGGWTCVVGELQGGRRMVTVAKWRDGATAEEYILM
jgi:hypothetical protein